MNTPQSDGLERLSEYLRGLEILHDRSERPAAISFSCMFGNCAGKIVAVAGLSATQVVAELLDPVPEGQRTEVRQLLGELNRTVQGPQWELEPETGSLRFRMMSMKQRLGVIEPEELINDVEMIFSMASGLAPTVNAVAAGRMDAASGLALAQRELWAALGLPDDLKNM